MSRLVEILRRLTQRGSRVHAGHNAATDSFDRLARIAKAERAREQKQNNRRSLHAVQ